MIQTKLLLILLLVSTLLFFNGCSCKPKYIYIKQKCPRLETFELNQTDVNTTLPKYKIIYEIKEQK